MARILVIEDNLESMHLAQFVLRGAGYRVLAASDATEGLALAHARLPDLVLMDIQLPDMDGLEATRRLKASPVTAKIPVVALTAFAMKGDRERMLAAGCDDYLAKPFHWKNLIEIVARAVGCVGAAERVDDRVSRI